MDNNYDNIKSFSEHVKSISLFSRIFNWKNVRSLTLRHFGQTKSCIEQTNFIIADPFAGSGQINTNKNWDAFVDHPDKAKMLWLQKKKCVNGKGI